MSESKPGRVSLAVAAVLVVAAVVTVLLVRAEAEPPVAAKDVALEAQLWVMPRSQVDQFLGRQHAPAALDRVGTGAAPVVVGHVSWTVSGPGAGRFALLLGDRHGGAGVIDEVLGRPDGEVSLGIGSLWNETTRSHDWLRGAAPVQLEGGGWTQHGSFATLPTSHDGDVWFVGRVLDVSRSLGQGGSVSAQPAPVLGVALTGADEDRVWWVREVAD